VERPAAADRRLASTPLERERDGLAATLDDRDGNDGRTSENQRGELLLTDEAHQLTAGGGKPGQGYSATLGAFGPAA
jgi:hypothetical protein